MKIVWLNAVYFNFSRENAVPGFRIYPYALYFKVLPFSIYHGVSPRR